MYTWLIVCHSVHLTPPARPTRQVARAGRFGTKGLAITFVSDETDAKTLNDVQDRFEVNVAELPDEIDISSYSKSPPYRIPIDDKEVLLGSLLCWRVGMTSTSTFPRWLPNIAVNSYSLRS